MRKCALGVLLDIIAVDTIEMIKNAHFYSNIKTESGRGDPAAAMTV